MAFFAGAIGKGRHPQSFGDGETGRAHAIPNVQELTTRGKPAKIRLREERMYLLAWIVIGAVIGWGAGRVFQGNGYGPLMDTLLGIGGGIVGGFAMSSAGLGGYGETIIITMVGMVGAVLLTVLAAYINGSRIFARQL
jgi:uncharacterized membrane protein YeaQ/YmgE (transglycosylase-associated protein family)